MAYNLRRATNLAGCAASDQREQSHRGRRTQTRDGGAEWPRNVIPWASLSCMGHHRDPYHKGCSKVSERGKDGGGTVGVGFVLTAPPRVAGRVGGEAKALRPLALSAPALRPSLSKGPRQPVLRCQGWGGAPCRKFPRAFRYAPLKHQRCSGWTGCVGRWGLEEKRRADQRNSMLRWKRLEERR